MARDFSEVRVIILSIHNNEENYWRAPKAGAAGFLLKKAATAELETALQRVVHGEIYLSREISARLPKKFPLDGITGRKSPLEQLTDRQREVLQLIAEGQNTRKIAEILKVSPKTVEYHRMKLMDCLNVHDIPALVRFALRVGLLPEGKLTAGWRLAENFASQSRACLASVVRPLPASAGKAGCQTTIASKSGLFAGSARQSGFLCQTVF